MKYLTEEGTPTFYSWMICRHLGKATPAGDFAYDMTFDKAWPEDNEYKSIYDHILCRPGYFSPEPALKVFMSCWKQYQKTLFYLAELE